jgi:hypothetical protein
MPRKSRPLSRAGDAVRDASLIVVASEDTYAAKDYFDRFKASHAQFKVIATEDCRSSPKAVMRRLDEFKNEYVTEENDTFWLCIDRDRWKEDSLLEVLRECRQKGYRIALSRPCFELWTLLHFEDLGSTPAHDCEAVIERLKAVLGGGYGKRCCRTEQITFPMVKEAMRRARAMDTEPNEFLPSAATTRVYQILDELLSSSFAVLRRQGDGIFQ